jgi:hypothetical protein
MSRIPFATLTASLDCFPAGAILHQQTGADNARNELISSTIESLADKVRRAALESACCSVDKRDGFNLFCRLPPGEAFVD